MGSAGCAYHGVPPFRPGVVPDVRLMRSSVAVRAVSHHTCQQLKRYLPERHPHRHTTPHVYRFVRTRFSLRTDALTTSWMHAFLVKFPGLLYLHHYLCLYRSATPSGRLF